MRWASRASVAVIAALCACAALDRGMLPGIDGPVVLPLYVAAESDVDDVALESAAAMWNDRSPLAFFELHPEMYEDCRDWGCDGVVTVYRATLDEGTRALAIVHAPRGEVTDCEIVLSNEWPDEDFVIAHELGHCLGLAHDDFSESIMHSPVQPYGEPTAHDVECALRGCEE